MKLAILEILEILQKFVTTKTSTLSYDVLQDEIFASEEENMIAGRLHLQCKAIIIQ